MSYYLDTRFIPDVVYRRIHGYSHIYENIYNVDPAAALSMASRIRAHAIFDGNLGQPRPCECYRRPGGKRCQEGSNCATRRAGFNCPLSCEVTYPSNPCMNRYVANEKFKPFVTIRAHRNVEKGRGIFAIAEINSNTYLGEVIGVVRIGDALLNSYCFEYQDTQFRRRDDQMLFLDLSDSGNEWRFLNTSCSPNAKLVTVAVGFHFRMTIVTTKIVHEDEEITVGYTENMLQFIPSHCCKVKNCIIRNHVKNRGEQEGQGSAEVQERACTRTQEQEKIREELTDAKSSRVFFEYSGLGPIAGIGVHAAGYRHGGSSKN